MAIFGRSVARLVARSVARSLGRSIDCSTPRPPDLKCAEHELFKTGYMLKKTCEQSVCFSNEKQLESPAHVHDLLFVNGMATVSQSPTIGS